jgi:hypothetical protein
VKTWPPGPKDQLPDALDSGVARDDAAGAQGLDLHSA